MQTAVPFCPSDLLYTILSTGLDLKRSYPFLRSIDCRSAVQCAAIWGHRTAFSDRAALGVLLLSCRLQFYFAPFRGGCIL